MCTGGVAQQSPSIEGKVVPRAMSIEPMAAARTSHKTRFSSAVLKQKIENSRKRKNTEILKLLDITCVKHHLTNEKSPRSVC
jgi:hypothetical protein